MNNQPQKVQINLYDLSQGMAKAFSPMFLGKQIDGIWHTGIVVFGKEYYFGGGICAGLPKQTPYGYPVQIIEHGETEITQEDFEGYLNAISSRYTFETYDLFKNNCNNFTNECSEFLLSKPLPDFITGLPAEVLNTQIGQMIKPMIDQLTQKAIQDTNSQHFGSQVNAPQSSSSPQVPQQDQQQLLMNNLASMLSNVNPNPQQQAPQSAQQNEQKSNVTEIEESEIFMCMTESSPKCIFDFYADWCAPCKVIKPKFAELSNTYQDVQFYSVNIDKAQEIAQQLNVTTIPTFIIYKNGQLIERWSGGDPITLNQKVNKLSKQ